ncbi:MAG: four helix bundle suffix domain-containing protein [bacterium]
MEHDDPAVRANALICLINQANFLLDHQIAQLERQFVESGGYSEQMASARAGVASASRLRNPRAAGCPTSSLVGRRFVFLQS